MLQLPIQTHAAYSEFHQTYLHNEGVVPMLIFYLVLTSKEEVRTRSKITSERLLHYEGTSNTTSSALFPFSFERKTYPNLKYMSTVIREIDLDL